MKILSTPLPLSKFTKGLNRSVGARVFFRTFPRAVPGMIDAIAVKYQSLAPQELERACAALAANSNSSA